MKNNREKIVAAQENEGNLSKKRAYFLLILLALFIVYLLYGLTNVMLIDANDIKEASIKRHTTTIERKGQRGKIVDRNGNILVSNQNTSNIIANPVVMDSAKVKGGYREMAKVIAENIDEEYEEVYDKLATSKRFVRLKRNVDDDDEIVEKIKQLSKKEGYKNGALGFEPWNKRFYPEGRNAAHITGYANFDNQGVNGLEKYFEDALAPKTMAESNIRVTGGAIAGDGAAKTADLDGRTIQLTIDTRIQSKAAMALENAVMLNAAVSGSIVVIDVKNGEILALANAPTYDPNDYGKADITSMRNHVVADFFEPGSVFKTFSTVAYLKKHPKVTITDILVPEPNPIVLDKSKTLHEHGYRHKNMTAADILAYSSNIGAAMMALDVGDVAYYQVLRDFGFGEKTGIEFGGEASGILQDPNKKSWKRVQLANIAFGQGVTVSTLQLAAAYAAIANDGYYNPPTIIKNSHEELGLEKISGRQVISQQQAKMLQEMLAEVVTRGTGKRAKPASYRAAGKTGTAQKAENGHYSLDNYMATFAGFAPLPNPRIAIVVNIDSPQPNHEGGTVSAPVFSEVMEEALRTLMVTPSEPEKIGKKTKPAPKEELRTVVVQEKGQEKEIVLKGAFPDLRNKSITEALEIINKLMIINKSVAVRGSGYVYKQDPPPGTMLIDVSGIKLECSPDKKRQVASK